MNQLFKFLEDKNYWYRKYLSSNEAYLQALKHAPEVALEELELFYGNRESLLKILEKLDKKVQVETALPQWQGELSSEVRTKLQHYIREKDSLIAKIVALDAEILGTMEALKTAGLEKLKLLSKGKKMISSYKSSPGQSEKIDKRV